MQEDGALSRVKYMVLAGSGKLNISGLMKIRGVVGRYYHESNAPYN